jgi:hypothetical protein
VFLALIAAAAATQRRALLVPPRPPVRAANLARLPLIARALLFDIFLTTPA